MKNLRTAALCAGVMLCSLLSMAQEKPPVSKPNVNKPHLFDNLPNSIPVSMDEINSLFTKEVGRNASLKMAGSISPMFSGEIVSTASQPGDEVKSVVIRSDNFSGANFTISKITNAGGKVSYVGRIISFQHGDLFELETQNGQLVLVKKNYYDLVNE